MIATLIKNASAKQIIKSLLILAVLTAGVITASLSPAALGADNDADLAVKGDLRNLANELETYYTGHQNYPGPRAVSTDGARKVTIGRKTVRLAEGDHLGTIRLTKSRQAYCIRVLRDAGSSDTSSRWRYLSDKGGITSGGCPARFSKVSG